MIKNERQYRITKAQADRFSQTLDNLRQRDPIIKTARGLN